MARTIINYKLSVHLPNCRGWPCQWVSPAVRSTHAGLAAARWPMHAAWRCRYKIYASAISTHIDRVALQLIYWLDSRNGTVGLERSVKKCQITWTGKMDSKLASVLFPEKMSSVTATQSIRKCRVAWSHRMPYLSQGYPPWHSVCVCVCVCVCVYIDINLYIHKYIYFYIRIWDILLICLYDC